jgi:hypothetical protein
VPIIGEIAVVVPDRDQEPVTGIPVSLNDLTAVGCDDFLSVAAGDIDALMIAGPETGSRAEIGGDDTIRRPI